MNDDKVIEFSEKFDIEDMLSRQSEKRQVPRPLRPEPETAAVLPPEPAAVVDLDRHALAKKADPMPETPQEHYRPHAGYLNRLQAEQRTFYCVFADCTFRGFPYAHYDGIRLVRADSPAGGLELVVRFSGSVVEEVRIIGQNLRFIAVCVGLGIMPWVWELPPGRQVDGDDQTIITSLTISEVEP
jgi:hypothetical protein